MKCFRLVLLLCITGSLARAEPARHVRFLTSPPDAEVRVSPPGLEAKLVGRAGQLVTLQSDWKAPNGLVTLEFRSPKHQPRREQVLWSALPEGKTWPPAGALALESLDFAPLSLRLLTEPAEVDVVLQTSSISPNDPGQELGKTGGAPLSIDPQHLQGSNLYLTLRAPGYEDKEVVIPVARLRMNSTWPPNKVPERLFQTWTGWLRARAFWLAAGALLLGLLVRRSMRKQATVNRQLAFAETARDGYSTWQGLAPELQTFGYQISGELGRGGMAVVYEVQRTDSTETLALKLLNRETSKDEDAVRRMKREIRILRDLVHPGIVPLYDYGQVHDQWFLVMEKVDGVSLRQRLEQGPLDRGEVLRMMMLLLQAVSYAHQRGVTHRDLKPDNVMLRSDGRVQVLDFGIARSTQSTTFVTMDDTILGTPAYMAPECFNGEVGQAADQYALGIMFYEMLTGRHPIGAQTLSIPEVLHRQLYVVPTRPSEVCPDLPVAVDLIIMTMLEKMPGERFDSVEEARDRLEAVLQFPIPHTRSTRER